MSNHTQTASKAANGATAALDAAVAVAAASGPVAADNAANSPVAPAAAIPAAVAVAVPAVPAEPSIADLMAQLAALAAANNLLQTQLATKEAKASKGLWCQIGEKGGVSVYGLGRFPITQYQEGWDKLIGTSDADPGYVPQLRAFIAENRSKLSVKPKK